MILFFKRDQIANFQTLRIGWQITMRERNHTVQDSQKSEEKCPGVLWYIFEIHYTGTVS